MFTGLIQEIGIVEGIVSDGEGARIAIGAELAAELGEGDSIAVSGVCLTAIALEPGRFAADVMNQTLTLTALGDLQPGGRVNLEPALRASDRLGGHIVQGHVDAAAAVVSVVEDGFARRVRVELPDGLERFVVERGSIALDGVSLTVSDVEGAVVGVSLIPETLERTTFGELEEGGKVNVEVDVLARHAERLLQGLEGQDGK